MNQTYQINHSSDNLSSRVFILQKSELEKRLDPFYYVPELLKLEKNVLAKNPKKLWNCVLNIASGATPKTRENEKYYTEKETCGLDSEGFSVSATNKLSCNLTGGCFETGNKIVKLIRYY